MTPYYSQPGIDIYHGSAERLPLADETVQTCVTSPPYWGLRDYGTEGQIGLEATPEEYVARLVGVFGEVRRVLRDDGTLWLNLGDSYHNYRTHMNGGAPTNTFHRGGSRDGIEGHVRTNRCVRQEGIKSKDLVGIPWMTAFALRADGWYLRSDIIWHKPNPMPESVTDRPTKAHEYLFLLSKSERYYYDIDAIREPHESDGRGGFSNKITLKAVRLAADHAPSLQDAEVNPLGRNRRSVWSIPTNPFPGAHFATFPPDLIEPCVKAGSRAGDLVLDPFNGSGTTGEVCRKWGRRYVGVELNAAYIDLSAERFRQGVLFSPQEVA